MSIKPYIGLEVRITPGKDENIEVVVISPAEFVPSPSTVLYSDLWHDIKAAIDWRMSENGYVYAGYNGGNERGDGIVKNVNYHDYSALFLCKDCRQDIYQLGEYYMVKDAVWAEAAPELVPPKRGMLCIGCLENRLGRKLRARDFTFCDANYYGTERKSQRLKQRMLSIWDDPQGSVPSESAYSDSPLFAQEVAA